MNQNGTPFSSRDKIYFAGVDVGSSATKACIIDAEENIIAYSVKKTTAEMARIAKETLEDCLRKSGLNYSDMKYTMATGYGGNVALSAFANGKITEITAHSRGARHLFPKCRTVIDIGGQDSKVMRLSDSGRILKFVMNDKCAAGTGRFLEVMSGVLGVKLEEMGEFSLGSRSKTQITSTCTVFAESEVVSLLSLGKNPVDIAAGLHEAIAKRLAGLARQAGVEDDVVATGGVAKNIGVVKALERELLHRIYLPAEPQIVGALGAAIIAREKVVERG